MIRRHGQVDGFWGQDGVAEETGASGTSRPVQLGQAVDQFVFYVDVSGATVITVEVAHSGEPAADGTGPEAPADADYKALYWMDKAINFTFTGSGSAAIIVPDFTPGWVRLKSSNDVSCLAGWEVSAP